MTPEKIKPRWVFRGASSEEKVAVPDFFNLNNIPEGTARIMMRYFHGREINAFFI